MPLKLNCGLTRKIGEANYGSRGASINVELELDSALVTEPTKLQDRIRQLFTIVRASLTEELNGNGHATPQENDNGPAHPPQNGNGSARNGNGSAPTSGQQQATQKQVKAIHAIARTRRIDVRQFLNDRFRVGRPDDLTLKEASQAIDDLKRDEKEGSRA